MNLNLLPRNQKRKDQNLKNDSISILGFGNPLLDITVKIQDDTLLKKYNIKSNDSKELTRDEIESLFQDISSYEKCESPGGCAQNTIRILKWACDSDPHFNCNNVYFSGSVGNDTNGELLKELLFKDKVQTRYVIKNDKPTGIAIALINDKDRALLAHLGAAQDFTLSDLLDNQELLNLLNTSNYIYMEGFFITKRKELVEYIVNVCNEKNKILLANISGKYLVDVEPEMLTFLLERSDYVFGNKGEFLKLANYLKKTNEIELAKHLSKDELRGGKGKVVIITNEASEIIQISEKGEKIEHIDVHKVEYSKIKDTIGAGDSFMSGYIYGLLTKKDLKTCCDLGSLVASKIIQQTGCTVPDTSLFG